MAKKSVWTYGQHPAPRDFQEVSEIIRAQSPKKKKKSSGLYEKIEKLIKEQRNGI